MKNLVSLFTAFTGLLGVGCFGYQMIESLDRLNLELLILFSLLTTISGLVTILSIKEIKGQD
jgi:hypothetical protein